MLHVSRQFYYFLCQFLLQHHAVLITLVLQCILTSFITIITPQLCLQLQNLFNYAKHIKLEDIKFDFIYWYYMKC